MTERDEYTPSRMEQRFMSKVRVDEGCAVEGCAESIHAKGLCGAHYQRARRHGSPEGGGAVLHEDIADRLWAKVEKTDSCWIWTGAKTTLGYGYIRVGKLSPKAYRLIYELMVGPIPEGLVLDHLCRNPSCVNPEHLEPVTQRENTLRGVSIVADQAKRTHCPRGHERAAGNLVPSSLKKGRRDCLTCSRERAKERRDAMRAR